MGKQSQHITGAGHQYQIDQRSFGSCKSHIENAMMSILDQKNDNKEVQDLFQALSDLAVKANDLEASCREVFEQNRF